MSAAGQRTGRVLRQLAQDRKAREICLHGGIVTGAARVPAARCREQRGAHPGGLNFPRGQTLRSARSKAAGGCSCVTAQLQTAQRPHGHALGGCELRDALADNGAQALAVEPLSVSFRSRRTNPLLTPLLRLLARAAQLRIGQCHRNPRQVEGIPERCVATLHIEQPLGVAQVAREHPRAGG